jgi:hypothetical protein
VRGIGLAQHHQVGRARMQADAGAGFVVDQHAVRRKQAPRRRNCAREGGQRQCARSRTKSRCSARVGSASALGMLVQQARHPGRRRADQVAPKRRASCAANAMRSRQRAVVDMHQDGFVAMALPRG